MKQTPSKLYLSLIYVILALVTFIAFEQVRGHDFVSLNDYDYVTQNPQVKGAITRESIFWAFTASHAGLLAPGASAAK